MTTNTDPNSSAVGEIEVETYYFSGVWHSRRGDCAQPFASSRSRDRMIAAGAEVARWNGLHHIIRDTAGTIVEVDKYVLGPYPSRSPASRDLHPRSRT